MATVYNNHLGVPVGAAKSLSVGVTGTSSADATKNSYMDAVKKVQSQLPQTSTPSSTPTGSAYTSTGSVYAPTSSPGAGAANTASSGSSQSAAPDGGQYINGVYYSPFDLQAAKNPDDFNYLTNLKNGYLNAVNSGDMTLAQKYNDDANAWRAQYGYYGGTDGTLGTRASNGMGATMGNSYAPFQFTQMGSLGDSLKSQNAAAVEAAKAAYTSAYNQSLIDLEAQAAKIPGMYQDARNQTSGSAALSAQNFNEYAAAAGLNSGAGGQAQLAMNNALMGEMGSLGRQEAQANQDVAFERQRIARAYQDALAQASANGQADLAKLLYQDAATVRGANFGLQSTQADENYRRWGTNYQVGRDFVNDSQYANAQNLDNQWRILEWAASTGDPNVLASVRDKISVLDPSSLDEYVKYLTAQQTPTYSGYGGYGTGYQAPAPATPAPKIMYDSAPDWAIAQALYNAGLF